jgi:hypothetical protein
VSSAKPFVARPPVFSPPHLEAVSVKMTEIPSLNEIKGPQYRKHDDDDGDDEEIKNN